MATRRTSLVIVRESGQSDGPPQICSITYDWLSIPLKERSPSSPVQPE